MQQKHFAAVKDTNGGVQSRKTLTPRVNNMGNRSAMKTQYLSNAQKDKSGSKSNQASKTRVNGCSSKLNFGAEERTIHHTDQLPQRKQAMNKEPKTS